MTGPLPPFKSILVYTPLGDDAFAAVDRAAWVARAGGASLTVLRVLEGAARLERWSGLGPDAAQLRDLVEQSQREILEARVAPLREAGVDVRVRVRWGKPWLELIHQVLRHGHDLVVKTAEGAARSGGLFFGSTALHLMRKCPCPVWVAGRVDDDARPRRVLAAIDPARDEDRSVLARRILDLAASMAGEEGELHAVSAWRAAGETLLRNRLPPEELAEYVRGAREEARSGLERLLADAGDPVRAEHVRLVKGEPREVLPALVEAEGYDLVVMGSVGRVGIAGLLIGETAETLIQTVRCSVLVAKPPGFACPVELPA